MNDNFMVRKNRRGTVMRIRIESHAKQAGLISLAAGTLALVVLPGQASAAGSAAAPTSSPQAYVNYLEAQEAADPAGVADQTLSGFQALSSDKQEAFLNYLNDPTLTQQFVSFLNGVEDTSGVAPDWDPNTGTVSGDDSPATSPFGDAEPGAQAAGTVLDQKTQAGGDVTDEAVVAQTGMDGSPVTMSPVTRSAARAGDWTAWYKVNDKVFGVKVTEVKIWVEYHSTTSKVTRVYTAGASHYNYVPFSSFSHSVISKWISAAGNAHAETTWTAHIDAGPSWSATEHIWANQRGFQGGSLH